MTSFRSPVPHPFNRPDVVSSRTPLETSAGQKVTKGRGGKARSAMDKKRKSAADIVDGMARAISPTNEEEGLNLLEAGIDRKREEIRASKAKEVAAAVAVERERERERYAGILSLKRGTLEWLLMKVGEPLLLSSGDSL